MTLETPILINSNYNHGRGVTPAAYAEMLLAPPIDRRLNRRMFNKYCITTLFLLALISNDLLAQSTPTPQAPLPVFYRGASHNQTSSILQRLEALKNKSPGGGKRDSGFSTTAAQKWNGRIHLVTNEMKTGDPLGDVQARLSSQAAKIAELQELMNGKVDNGTSRNSVVLSGRIHADYW